ncbi:MAG: hypothetical protein F4X35_10580 [Alphaproteobacteria bacterium]|nr:hypothetical protein [Alphaproteobacteria bacterium]
MTERPILTVKEAHAYLVQRMGRFAPTFETLRSWLRPSFRARRRVPEGFPEARKVLGLRRHAISRDELEAWLTRNPRPADALTVREAHAYLVDALGSFAPTLETLRTWLRPSARAQRRMPEGFPEALKVPGARKRVVRQRDLDAWIDRVNREWTQRHERGEHQRR